MHILHLGCGRKKLDAEALFHYTGLSLPVEAARVTHLDADAALAPDIVCRLGAEPIPLPDNSVDVVVAWHVLEHIGQQGQTAEWFAFWEDLYRVLVPNGWVYGECPYYSSLWAWSDPTHTRAISEHSFLFFAQDSYRIQPSAISPYRIACDFGRLGLVNMPDGYAVISDTADPRIQSIRFGLIAIKPLKPWWEDAA
jgi:SAM-dependent methyltransferase